jgi:hypothetical protein
MFIIDLANAYRSRTSYVCTSFEGTLARNIKDIVRRKQTKVGHKWYRINHLLCFLVAYIFI